MKLPEILAVDRPRPDEIILTLNVPADHKAFDGHFPGTPILPGVVQIDWVVRFAMLHLGLPEPSHHNFQVKFQSIIVPEQLLSLSLRYDAVRKRLSFSYQEQDKIMSSGAMKWEAAP